MTIEWRELKTLQEVAAAQAAGEEIELRLYSSSTWVKWDELDFYNNKYRARPKDPYAELKKAAADPTKQIRIKPNGTWADHNSWTWKWSHPPEAYEIRNKPKTKKIQLEAWLTPTRLIYFREGTNEMSSSWKRVPSEDKIIEVEE